jgi:crotonobetainyl-CoA:carnitine CoA-transferase CaiB-like acyl-CoA transferase
MHASGAAYLQPSGPAYAQHPELPPLSWPGVAPEVTVGVHVAIGVLAALIRRRRVGRGAMLDISKQECLTTSVRNSVESYARDNEVEKRESHAGTGRQGPFSHYPLSGTVRCRDGFVTLWGVTGFIAPLLAWLGHEDWFARPEWSDDKRRGEQADSLRGELETEFQRFDKETIYHGLQRRGIGVAPMRKPDELFSDRQLAARGFFTYEPDSAGRSVPFCRLPFVGLPQIVGQGTAFHGSGAADPVLHHALGCSEPDVQALVDAGVLSAEEGI